MHGDLRVARAGLDHQVAPAAPLLELLPGEGGEVGQRGRAVRRQPEPVVEQAGAEPHREGEPGRREVERGADLPAFAGEQLQEWCSGGDLVIQACAGDPQVAVHAVRVLTEAGQGVVRPRWLQSGYLPAPADGGTPRNLFGFRDGSANLPATDPAALARHVWAAQPGWMAGGSYLVVRRIRMLVADWDAAPLAEQEEVFGRRKAWGRRSAGTGRATRWCPSSCPRSRTRGSPPQNGGAQLLRRGYSYTDGFDAEGLDAGLVFLAYQRDPRAQFVPIMRRLAAHDALNEYTRHVGSALFACPPGVGPSGWWGEQLFSA